MQFSELIGQEVSILIPKVNPITLHRVKVVGVEAGGIWIASQEATNALLQKLRVQTSPRSFEFFLPFHEITFAYREVDEVGLNERAFDV